MTTRIKWSIPAWLVLFLLPITAAASASMPVETNGFYNGHYYEVVPYPPGTPTHDKLWDDAKLAAEARMLEYAPGMFVAGHLATITSEGEDLFIESLRSAAHLSPPEAWVGGMTDGLCSPTPGCGWAWINGEGAISTPQVPLPLLYSNWQPNEPNDAGGERHLGIGHQNNVGWNDEGRLGNIGGYVVEYDVPVEASECVEGGEGCPLSVGSNITFPQTVELEGEATIDVRRYEFTDDPALCGNTPRLLFGPSTDPDGLIPDAILPAYLCGSPKFLVILAETEGIVLPDGTIFVENEATDVFPGNLYDCPGPIAPDPQVPNLNPDDPQNRDVMAWQSTDLTEMPENDLGAMHGFEGSVGEFTFECGSSRGKTNGLSYYFVGLHIDFGPNYDDFAANPDGVRDQFARLTRYKLHVLKDVIVESQVALNDTFFQRIGFRIMRRLVTVAIRLHDRGRYVSARFALQLLDLTLQNLNYTEIQGENYSGATDMRNSNAIFMYTDKVIPPQQ